MTSPVDSATHCERDDTAENCGIEITPEMIRAGADVLWEMKDQMDSYSLAVEVYRAMAALGATRSGREPTRCHSS